MLRPRVACTVWLTETGQSDSVTGLRDAAGAGLAGDQFVSDDLGRIPVIQLPEGPQRCTVTLTRARYRSSHFPLLHVTRSFVSFDFHPPVDTGGQKGPIWGMAVEADSIEDGIYKMRQRILAERVRNGYENAPARVAS